MGNEYWLDEKPPKSLLEYKEKYPHKAPYDACLGYINWQTSYIKYLTKDENRIRIGYRKRIDRLEDKLEQRENELADFKLRLKSALDCVEELYNTDCIHYTEKDSKKIKNMLEEVYNRAGMLLQIERGYGENKGFK